MQDEAHRPAGAFGLLQCTMARRGRDEDFSSPPAQIPACAANAPGLYEEAAVKGYFGGV